MYAEEKNRLECECIGARNKMALKSSLLFEKARFEQLNESLVNEKRSISSIEVGEIFSNEYKFNRINDIDKMLKSTADDILLVGNLFDQISNIEICGE